MKVSVIVPVYNTEKYLHKCLSSLAEQTIDEIEIIAVDDGATDNSGKILDEYKEKYPDRFVVFHKANGGQASARNLALQHTSGEFIGFLDSDDFVELTMFEKLYNKAIENDADYVGCGYKDLLDTGNDIKVLNPYVGNKPRETNIQMYQDALVSPFINFYKGDILRNNNILFTEGYIYEDTAFWAKIVPYIKHPVYVEEALACRVRHSNSTTTITKASKVANIFPVIEDIIDYYKENNFWDEYRNEIESFCSKILLCSSMERISRVEASAERKELVKETYLFLDKHFPNYKNNPYFTSGAKNFYIKHSSPFLSKLYIFAARRKKNEI